MKAQLIKVIQKLKMIPGKKILKIAVFAALAVIVAGAVYHWKFKSKSANAEKQQSDVVRRGNLAVTVSGSGTIKSSNRSDISPVVDGTVKKVYFKEGDKVKAGDLLYELDDSNAQLNLEKINNEVKQAELSLESSQSDASNLLIKAPFSGQVTGVKLKNGDILNKNATVLTITDQSKLKLVVPFGNIKTYGIKTGQKATVNIQDFMQTIEGEITYISDKPYSTSSGGELYSVEISITNPGSLKEGMTASAEISTSKGTAESVDSGILEYLNNQVVTSSTGGKVTTVNVKENQYVNAGDILVSLEDTNVDMSVETNNIKLKDLQSQQASAQEQMDQYKIYAPFDGVLVSQSVKEGDALRTGTAMSTITDVGHMEFDISIDELDISKIKVGQMASITVDALSETTTKPLTGKVTKVATEGSGNNGVTTFPVTVQINETENLKVGMNVTADISISEKSNVLLVPIEAVTKAGQYAFVWVPSDGSNTDAGFGGFPQGGGQNGNWSNNNQNGGNSDNSNGNNSSNGGNNSGRRSRQGGNLNGNGGAGNSGQNINGGNSGNGNASGNFRNRMANNSYYKNATIKRVEIGINNENYIEIVSGLNEGDTVILPPTVQASSSNSNNMGNNRNQSGFGGFGGMGGGTGNRNAVVIPKG